ncbi:DUF4258 domain-containing protein [bacterium]|nr:MAG: DUF4258 domain-containing protein [bacterium]
MVFLLVSTQLQGIADKAKTTDPCPEPKTSLVSPALLASPALVLAALEGTGESAKMAKQQAISTIKAGYRTLLITRHAAQRMAERGVSREVIALALERGKLFAYKHARGGGLIKIGYYLSDNAFTGAAKGVFVAVDQVHEKVVTVIRGVPVEYIRRLIRVR